jgi:hypothetical protein
MLKRICFVALVSLFVVGFGALAGADVVTSFKDLCSDNWAINMSSSSGYDNLMIRDPDTGIDSVVSGFWSMGFLKAVPGGAQFVGYADNLNRSTSGMEGFLSGYYSQDLGQNDRPDGIWLIHDANENGIIGRLEGEGEEKSFHVDNGDNIYYAKDILFGPEEIRGDLSQLPVYPTGDGILPHMVISPQEDEPSPNDVVSEPTALLMLGLSGLALKRRRS